MQYVRNTTVQSALLTVSHYADGPLEGEASHTSHMTDFWLFCSVDAFMARLTAPHRQVCSTFAAFAVLMWFQKGLKSILKALMNEGLLTLYRNPIS